ncbi:MAG TPA: flagellar basal-body rod protein FlgF [Pyrinomonadaceae bacterium]
MNFGLYAAYLGMRSRQQQLDLLANNIANASTAGFKADRMLFRSVVADQNQKQQNQNPGNSASAAGTPSTATDQNTQSTPVRYGLDVGVVTGQLTDFSPGPTRETGRSLDIALDGDGFIAVQTPRGERYTRQGSLTIDNSGQLVTQRGELVIGDSGPITVPPGNVTFGEDGTIFANGQIAGKLKLVRFNNPNTALIKEGDCLFAAKGTEQGQEATNTRVLQGTLESSNVNSLTEMVAMMQNSREFESLQKSVSTIMNELGRKISNEIGRL